MTPCYTTSRDLTADRRPGHPDFMDRRLVLRCRKQRVLGTERTLPGGIRQMSTGAVDHPDVSDFCPSRSRTVGILRRATRSPILVIPRRLRSARRAPWALAA
jgi:hypothetical protein